MSGLAAYHQKFTTSLLLLEANTKPNQHHKGFIHLKRILHSSVVQRLHYLWQLYIVFSQVHGKIIAITFWLYIRFPALIVLLKGRNTLFVYFTNWASVSTLWEVLLLDWIFLFTTIVLPDFVIAARMDQDILNCRRENIHEDHSQTITILILDG